MLQKLATGWLTMEWETDHLGTVTYTICAIEDSGQIRIVDRMEQGPFDTALEVAQWAWRVLARELPPSTC